jgi:hypothetical protein
MLSAPRGKHHGARFVADVGDSRDVVIIECKFADQAARDSSTVENLHRTQNILCQHLVVHIC